MVPAIAQGSRKLQNRAWTKMAMDQIVDAGLMRSCMEDVGGCLMLPRGLGGKVLPKEDEEGSFFLVHIIGSAPEAAPNLISPAGVASSTNLI
jgi:hypothetical protein